MNLHLIDHRLYLGEVGKFHHAVGIVIGYADGTKLASSVKLLQGTPGSVGISERLMQQHQVKVISAKLFHGFKDGFLTFLIAIMLNPNLGGQEDFLAVNTGFFYGGAYLLLVEIALGRIQAAIACIQGIQHAAFTFLLGNLIHAVAQLGHFHAIA